MDVKFGSFDAESNLGLKLLSMEKSPPEPMIVTTSVPGRDGSLDQSTAVSGFITYNDREIELLFTLRAETQSEMEEALTSVMVSLHGKRLNIILPGEPGFYYDSRLRIEVKYISDIFAEVTVLCTAYPYKRKTADTVVSKSVAGSAVIICQNHLEPVVPTIKTTTKMQIKFRDKTFAVDPGTHLLDIVFGRGDNTLTVTGTGTITITYREGCL